MPSTALVRRPRRKRNATPVRYIVVIDKLDYGEGLSITYEGGYVGPFRSPGRAEKKANAARRHMQRIVRELKASGHEDDHDLARMYEGIEVHVRPLHPGTFNADETVSVFWGSYD